MFVHIWENQQPHREGLSTQTLILLSMGKGHSLSRSPFAFLNMVGEQFLNMVGEQLNLGLLPRNGPQQAYRTADFSLTNCPPASRPVHYS
jgi:hypothetical protein